MILSERAEISVNTRTRTGVQAVSVSMESSHVVCPLGSTNVGQTYSILEFSHHLRSDNVIIYPDDNFENYGAEYVETTAEAKPSKNIEVITISDDDDDDEAPKVHNRVKETVHTPRFVPVSYDHGGHKSEQVPSPQFSIPESYHDEKPQKTPRQSSSAYKEPEVDELAQRMLKLCREV